MAGFLFLFLFFCFFVLVLVFLFLHRWFSLVHSCVLRSPLGIIHARCCRPRRNSTAHVVTRSARWSTTKRHSRTPRCNPLSSLRYVCQCLCLRLSACAISCMGDAVRQAYQDVCEETIYFKEVKWVVTLEGVAAEPLFHGVLFVSVPECADECNFACKGVIAWRMQTWSSSQISNWIAKKYDISLS